jgi:hypothetical protein
LGPVFVVSKAMPTMSWVVASKTFGDAPFDINTPQSNNPDGSFVFTSSDPEVASVVGKRVTIKKAGTCTFTATQADTVNYLSETADTVFVVSKAMPTMSWVGRAPGLAAARRQPSKDWWHWSHDSLGPRLGQWYAADRIHLRRKRNLEIKNK